MYILNCIRNPPSLCPQRGQTRGGGFPELFAGQGRPAAGWPAGAGVQTRHLRLGRILGISGKFSGNFWEFLGKPFPETPGNFWEYSWEYFWEGLHKSIGKESIWNSQAISLLGRSLGATEDPWEGFWEFLPRFLGISGNFWECFWEFLGIFLGISGKVLGISGICRGIPKVPVG